MNSLSVKGEKETREALTFLRSKYTSMFETHTLSAIFRFQEIGHKMLNFSISLISPQFKWPIFIVFLVSMSQTLNSQTILNTAGLAKHYYNEDAAWYEQNIPFFECSDQQMEQVYYYRWKLYKAHIRNTGDNSYVITEFINHVSWDRDPFCTINAASMHHIYEGRWLKDNRFMDGYIHYLYQQGGNNRRYSESIGDATLARYLVNADTGFATRQLDSMIAIYNQWSDHWDAAKNMYYIPAMPDATEYTIASIDASGGKDGFEGGEAFRPTINSYMYGNALAISRLASLQGDRETSNEFMKKALALKANVENNLWNDSLEHFIDRYQVDNQYVHYWDFIRGRELAGMIPWYFNLPSDTRKFSNAWVHVLDTNYLLGNYGLRTNEPSYEHYFRQFIIYQGQRGSQWNGPSWPYQTSQALTAMANLLNNYQQITVTRSDYLKLLRQFTMQHFLPDGKLNLVENYDPNLSGPIVYYYWSNHYLHSSFNNLIISGLCGIRPSESDTLDINPLIDNSIQYFCLDDVRYHGHKLTIVYDEDGSKYKMAKGLTVFVDGVKKQLIENQDKYKVVIGKATVSTPEKQAVNVALNIRGKGYPIPSASVNATPDTSLFQAIDGRIWYFPEITNRWTSLESITENDWFSIDFGTPYTLTGINIYLFSDGKTFAAPEEITLEYYNGKEWISVKKHTAKPPKPIGNTVNTILFNKIETSRIRVNFRHVLKQVAVTEIEFF